MSTTEAQAAEQPEDPRVEAAKVEGNGETGREMLAHVAMGATLDPDEEKSALDWLLGDPVQIPHEIPFTYETPKGLKDMKFIMLQSDPSAIDKIEQRHVVGGTMDQAAADLEIVATLCDAIAEADDKDGSKAIELTSSKFRTMRLKNTQTNEVEDHTFADPMQALDARFRGQQGVLMGVAREVRRVAGYDSSRVGLVQRRLVQASLG
jgi:hypothetical protein